MRDVMDKDRNRQSSGGNAIHMPRGSSLLCPASTMAIDQASQSLESRDGLPQTPPPVYERMSTMSVPSNAAQAADLERQGEKTGNPMRLKGGGKATRSARERRHGPWSTWSLTRSLNLNRLLRGSP
jgi:hypothetical protein